MIALQSDVRVYLACGYTDMRKGMQGLAMLVQQVLAEDPFNGAMLRLHCIATVAFAMSRLGSVMPVKIVAC